MCFYSLDPVWFSCLVFLIIDLSVKLLCLILVSLILCCPHLPFPCRASSCNNAKQQPWALSLRGLPVKTTLVLDGDSDAESNSGMDCKVCGDPYCDRQCWYCRRRHHRPFGRHCPQNLGRQGITLIFEVGDSLCGSAVG